VGALIGPVTAQLPAGLQFRQVIAVLIVIFACFLAGLIVRTGPGLRAKNAIERNILDRIPGYALIRGLASRVAGRSEDETFAVALVELEDALVPAFIVEEHDDGAYTVFVPSVPTPAAGAIYILPKEAGAPRRYLLHQSGVGDHQVGGGSTRPARGDEERARIAVSRS
jgi:uncharacterized membrane protein